MAILTTFENMQASMARHEKLFFVHLLPQIQIKKMILQLPIQLSM